MDSLDLSRRAVAAGWEWRAGALDTVGRRVTDVDDKGIPCAWTYTDGEHFAKPFNNYGIDEFRAGFWNLMLPDFDDAPTRGALLDQVRRRWADPTICTDCDGLHWSVVRVDGTVLAYGESETDALVAALEAAPKR